MSVVRFEAAPRSLRELIAPYTAFAAKAFSREATYRMEVFTNVGSLLVRLYLMKAVWTALYAQNAAPAGVPLHAVLTYTTIALLMSLVLEVDGTRAIRDKIREGTIATDLMKPISLPLYFFSDGVGMTLLHAVLIIPALLLALVIVRIDVPPAPVLLAFAFSFLLGYLVNFCLNFLMNCIAFWTLETFAIQLMVRWVSDLLSGQIVPLIFFPGLFQKIVLALPFAAIYSTPLLIYLGTIPPSDYLRAFAVQAGWCAVFAGLSALVWRAAQRRVVVQGG
ncbi:MAG TPA: ABC-2 family transporter protein [Candidatus Elarobacter sp.]|jgi:ABC-2 type transport system permease protein|nr:ABC-2 family transporter protein [Candidatus Elarobacter sp.]